MHIVNNLTAKSIVNYPNFAVFHDGNFEDDGNHFKGFIYKGILPLSALRSDGQTYVHISWYALQEEFTLEEFLATKEHALCDEFNGCDKLDMDKLEENCSRVLQKCQELNAICAKDIPDMIEVKTHLKEELAFLDSAVEEIRKCKWWKLSDYALRDLKRDLTGISMNIENLTNTYKEIEADTLCRRIKKELSEHLKKYGFVKVDTDYFYIRDAKELIQKAEET